MSGCRRGTRSGNRVVALLPLGEEEHGEQRDQQDGALQQQSRSVNGQRVQHRVAARGIELPGDDDDGGDRRDQAAEREQDLGAVAGPPGQECFHQNADHRDAEDDENR